MKTDAFPVHKIDDSQIELLKNLCAALAVSGDEGEVRKLILQAISPFTDECRVDALGNVLAVRKAKVADPMRVMLAAHVDEVGFMIVNEDEAGIYRFEVIGGINERYLPGKHVLVGKDHIPGVIGIFPIHLSEEGAEAKGITSRELRIDIGLDAEGKVKPGDKASFASRFEVMGGSISDRALDNRLGVAILISLIKHAPPHLELHAAFTVQEEIGLRGAGVAAYALNPHVALSIDCTPAYDLPIWDDSENHQYNAHLDAGPAIYIADRRTLHDPRLVAHLKNTAEKHHIPFQMRQPGGGSTDSGVIHLTRSGIPAASISVPCRFLHSPRSLARVEDWKNTLNLLSAALYSLDSGVLDSERS